MHLSVPVVLLIVACAAANENPQYFAQPYAYYPNYDYNYVPDQRNILTTSTSTTTLVSTITCTRSTNVACAGRKRRSLLDKAEDSLDQFPVEPTAVLGVETSAIEPLRESRAADPQILVAPAQGYQPQSAFYSGPYYRPVAVPYYGGDVRNGQDRFALGLLNNLITIRTTTTVFSISTSTSTPTCSTTGSFFQCPNA